MIPTHDLSDEERDALEITNREITQVRDLLKI